jgi:hypothetical protein
LARELSAGAVTRRRAETEAYGSECGEIRETQAVWPGFGRGRRGETSTQRAAKGRAGEEEGGSERRPELRRGSRWRRWDEVQRRARC